MRLSNQVYKNTTLQFIIESEIKIEKANIYF